MILFISGVAVGLLVAVIVVIRLRRAAENAAFRSFWS